MRQSLYRYLGMLLIISQQKNASYVGRHITNTNKRKKEYRRDRARVDEKAQIKEILKIDFKGFLKFLNVIHWYMYVSQKEKVEEDKI